MAGAERSRAAPAAIVAVALVAIAGSSPSSVAAVDEAMMQLQGWTYSAITVDIDGDGSRELVRVTSEANGGSGRVEAWGHGAAGWAAIGSAGLLRRDEAGGVVQVAPNRDPVALLAWRIEGRDSVLVIAAGGRSGQAFESSCCLSLAEVRGEDGGIALHPLPAPELAASLVRTADLDADGTDEIVVLEASRIPTGPQRLKVLRWSGSALEFVLAWEDPGQYLGVSAGDSDGVPGDELLIGPTVEGRLERISWVDGEPRNEVADLNLGRRFDGWVVGVADGAIVVALSDGVRVLRWPRGEDAADAGRLDSGVFPSVYALGRGSEAMIVSFDSAAVDTGEPTATVYDLALRRLGEVEASAAATDLWNVASAAPSEILGIDRPLFPYVGPVPNGWSDGRPAFIANGALILAGVAGFETRPISALAGLHPIGLAGPDGEWMALADSFFFASDEAFLFAGPGAGSVSLVPLENLLQPDVEAPTASLELRNAVETSAAIDGARTMLADGDGFEVVVTAAPGSRVLVVNDWRSELYEVGNVPVVAEVRAPRGRQPDKNQPLNVSLVIVSPEGRVSTTSWEGTFVRVAPELSVSASTDTLSLRAVLEGSASPGVTVTANGQALETDAQGHFAALIDAPIWPSTVIVTAGDALGNETTELVDVVGFVDYRGLPWPGIVVLATLVAGAVLYLRVPTPRARSVATAIDGDAALEEIELDGAQRRL